MLARLLVAIACLVHPTHSFVPLHLGHSAVHTRSSAFVTTVVAYGMPERLSEWGCDSTLWDGMPPGSHMDLERYVLTEKEELAKNRIATLRDIISFVERVDGVEPGAVWEQVKWDKGVRAWETDAMEKSVAEAARAKAEKKEKAKAAREAAEAAKVAQQHSVD